MKHLIDINQLTESSVLNLIHRAIELKHQTNYPSYSHFTIAHLFYEHSTRTRISFELAARKLGISVINFEAQHSSEQKGEAFQDTIRTLLAMGIQLFVLRHAEEGMPQAVAELCGERAHVINAGDGQHAHPSQALLDMMTILEKNKQPKQLKIAIVGDLRHSRVANSLQHLCAVMQVGELVLIAPDVWQPKAIHYGRTTTSLREGLSEADVVICLRVQRERLSQHEQLDLSTYRHEYAIRKDTLCWAKKDAMLMHPGPMNRGIEINSDVADGPQSYILQQVENGVFMRMAIFDMMCRCLQP